MVTRAQVQHSNAALTSQTAPRTAVFLGGTSGLGKLTLIELVSLGFPIRVYIAGRKATEPAMRPVLEDLRQKNPRAELVWVEAEVSLLAETRRVYRGRNRRLSFPGVLLPHASNPAPPPPPPRLRLRILILRILILPRPQPLPARPHRPSRQHALHPHRRNRPQPHPLVPQQRQQQQTLRLQDADAHVDHEHPLPRQARLRPGQRGGVFYPQLAWRRGHGEHGAVSHADVVESVPVDESAEAVVFGDGV
ncbi:hypothetical protein CSIM01_12034 [Colletotrichum simmondsii]|uniref:Ketoreductase (KR) domain-containing protein n=1 Tax=Colletotrichum simmondsii TaxID=703756 RepID=A0A135RU57_9PEZI|nr:hypothetical protein CSIM01_12034 [Colletotrichum simmondsii]